jgi:hypothetical protein
MPIGKRPESAEFLSLKDRPVAPKRFRHLSDLIRARKHHFETLADLSVVGKRIQPLAVLI